MKLNLSWAGGLTGVLLLSLSLAACGGSATTTEEVDPYGTESVVVTEEPTAETNATEEPTVEATEVVVEQEESEEEEATSTNEENLLALGEPVAGQASCFPIDIPTNNLIAAVSDGEWSKGPADAPVTVIEYGDFQ